MSVYCIVDLPLCFCRNILSDVRPILGRSKDYSETKHMELLITYFLNTFYVKDHNDSLFPFDMIQNAS